MQSCQTTPFIQPVFLSRPFYVLLAVYILYFHRSQNSKNSSFEKWVAQREETESWLQHISLLLSSAIQIVDYLQNGTSVIVHCRYDSVQLKTSQLIVRVSIYDICIETVTDGTELHSLHRLPSYCWMVTSGPFQASLF